MIVGAATGSPTSFTRLAIRATLTMIRASSGNTTPDAARGPEDGMTAYSNLVNTALEHPVRYDVPSAL